MACKLCKNLVKDADQQSRLWLEFTPQELRLSARDHNCLSCAILLEGIILMQAEGWSFEHDVSRAYGYGLASEKDTLALELYFYDERPRIVLEYFIAQDSKTCLNEHDCASHTMRQLPSRILVIERACNGEVLVKLAQTPIEVSKYATLRHCWGTQLSCTTTLGNISERRCGIQWPELPGTFQDAILYCIELEIYYLWIDALCIIQDSSIDWQVESSRMAQIYQNSYITLAATQSSSDCVGFLRRPSTTNNEYSWHVVPHRETYRLGIRPRLPHWSRTDLRLWAQDYPLLTRAWAFQERILSPRVLHFCKQELVWECAQAIRCECEDLTSSSSLKTRFCLVPMSKGDNTQDEDDNFRPMQDFSENVTSIERCYHLPNYWSFAIRNLFVKGLLLNEWNHAVSEYSSLELTKEEDRLPALSGLAARMKPHMGTYSAGLWESSLICGLTWRVDVLKPGARRPSRYRAPTWSWASVDSKVTYWAEAELMPPSNNSWRSLLRQIERSRHSEGNWDDEDDWVVYEGDRVFQQHQRHTSRTDNPQPSARALEVCVRAEEGNPFGQVSSGILFVEGILQPGKVWDDRASLPLLPPSKIESDGPRFKIEVSMPRCANVPSVVIPFYADYVLNDGADNPIYTPTVYLLTLCPGIGLVLETTPLKIKDCYIFRRIGILRLSYELHDAYGIRLTAGRRMKVGII
ncbi:HET-domain-containing protein [Xylaria sp. FL0043]|nr:HET-domain-containing protein [Xylaria sp. FL0043]